MTQEVVEELREGKFHVLSLGGGLGSAGDEGRKLGQ